MYMKSISSFRAMTLKNPQNNFVRLRHKLNKEKVETKPSKVAADVINYLESTPDYHGLKDQVPKALLRKYKTPESMYLINRKTAKLIADNIKTHLNNDSRLVEVNPGLGLLTQELLKSHDGHLYLYEESSSFSQHLNDLQKQYPGRIKWMIADFFGMWKLAFKDKMDDGNRIEELLGDLATEKNDSTVKIVGAMPGLSFVKHLIHNVVFKAENQRLGRPELFITMPGHHLEFLTDTEIQLSRYKSLPALFQLLFDCKVLNTVPKVHYLPWTHPTTNKRVTMMDEYCLYLVKITWKEKLPCHIDYLPLLWYFFKPHVFSKSTKVIPMLEQWIPGSGVWLITGQDPPDTKKELGPSEDDAALPHMTIFTEFGDLTLAQKITVFKRFISWPEFEQCQFRPTMESNLPKFVTHSNDEKEIIGTQLDEIDHSDSETET